MADCCFPLFVDLQLLQWHQMHETSWHSGGMKKAHSMWCWVCTRRYLISWVEAPTQAFTSTPTSLSTMEDAPILLSTNCPGGCLKFKYLNPVAVSLRFFLGLFFLLPFTTTSLEVGFLSGPLLVQFWLRGPPMTSLYWGMWLISRDDKWDKKVIRTWSLCFFFLLSLHTAKNETETKMMQDMQCFLNEQHEGLRNQCTTDLSMGP